MVINTIEFCAVYIYIYICRYPKWWDSRVRWMHQSPIVCAKPWWCHTCWFWIASMTLPMTSSWRDITNVVIPSPLNFGVCICNRPLDFSVTIGLWKFVHIKLTPWTALDPSSLWTICPPPSICWMVWPSFLADSATSSPNERMWRTALVMDRRTFSASVSRRVCCKTRAIVWDIHGIPSTSSCNVQPGYTLNF